jgi:uncharacterized membrane protein YeaQ/YmgE (transglycosylase-associated protein family)
MIYTLLTGLVAGAVAGLIVRGKGYGCILNIIVGIIGAWVGNWIFREIGFPRNPGLLSDIFTSVAGAVVLLLTINLIRKIMKD